MRIIFCVLTFLLFFSCSKKSNPDGSSNTCIPIVIDADRFLSEEDTYMIATSLSLDGDCLTAMVGFSGCDANHDAIMISDGTVNFSLPPQISFRFIDTKPQLCEAYFQKEFEFDLSALKESVGQDVLITVVDGDATILYEID